jgi:hypothetical protein
MEKVDRQKEVAPKDKGSFLVLPKVLGIWLGA